MTGFSPTPEQAEALAARGIPASAAEAAGVRSATTPADLPEGAPEKWGEWLPALLIPWRANDGRVEWQIRPDTPAVDHDGKAIKYATRSRDDGYEPVLWAARRGDPDGPHLLVEGTCQTLCAATWAPEGTTVVGMIGCRGWSSEGIPLADLALFEGKHVVVVLDADMATNPNVWDAGESLSHALAAEGAKVEFLRLPGSGKAGLDDVLGRRPEHQRTAHLARLIETAEIEKFPKSRRPKPAADPDSFFGDSGLRVEKLSKDIFGTHPSALTSEEKIALYADGVYEINGTAFIGAVAERLGDDFRPGHRAAVEEFTRGTLHRTGRLLPVHTDLPLLNVANGMLDLVTGTLKPHDPVYMSSVQFPIEWDGDSQCPTYLEWCASVGILDQLDDLEEVVSMMLDPSRTPTKAAFLFGPSRSGKSTFLRLLEAVAGMQNVSGVSLKQLGEDKHAAANVYGKALNVSADLSSAHVEDLSLFKMLTGEDLITADRKFGNQFVFRNRALFAFSANELPTVSESSRAYSERIKPFMFGSSFAGHEDPTIEQELKNELPGVLVRWVGAWQRLAHRGTYLSTSAAVRHEFEVRSDRVRQFVADELAVEQAIEGRELTADRTTTPTELVSMFKAWSESTGGGARGMGRNKLVDRLTAVPGVVRVRRAGSGQRALNVYRRPGGDPWDGGEPPPGSSEGSSEGPKVPSGSSAPEPGSEPFERGVGSAGSQVRRGASSSTPPVAAESAGSSDRGVPGEDTPSDLRSGSFARSNTGTAGVPVVPAELPAAERQGGVGANEQVRGVEGGDPFWTPPSAPGCSGSFGANSQTVEKQSFRGSGDPLPQGCSRGGKTAGTAGTAGDGGVLELTFDDDGAQALRALLAAGPVAAPYRPDPCLDCDGPLSLVPVSAALGFGFWFACRSCHSATFVRV